jgi:hypothetical protein
MSMAESSITVEILKGIRDELREFRADANARFEGVNARLDNVDARIDTTNEGLEITIARLDANNERLEVVERTVLDTARELRVLVGHVQAISELEPRVSRLEARVDELESKS